MYTDLHTFVICAYKESPYLEECINSILSQSVKSKVIIATSTPNEFIKSMASKFSIELFINNNKPEISSDWNFAINQVNTKYFTIAHQDDIYKTNYVEFMLSFFKRSKHPLIFFSNYSELRKNGEIDNSSLLNIKRIMLFPLKLNVFWNSKWIRRIVLSFGNPICCPAVSYCKDNLFFPIFSDHFKCDLDWDAWERISKLDGDFLYCSNILVSHRIHEKSTTTELIDNHIRTAEDLEMFQVFWPNFFAKFINKIYSKSEDSNTLK